MQTIARPLCINKADCYDGLYKYHVSYVVLLKWQLTPLPCRLQISPASTQKSVGCNIFNKKSNRIFTYWELAFLSGRFWTLTSCELCTVLYLVKTFNIRVSGSEGFLVSVVRRISCYVNYIRVSGSEGFLVMWSEGFLVMWIIFVLVGQKDFLLCG